MDNSQRIRHCDIKTADKNKGNGYKYRFEAGTLETLEQVLYIACVNFRNYFYNYIYQEPGNAEEKVEDLVVLNSREERTTAEISLTKADRT